MDFSSVRSSVRMACMQWENIISTIFATRRVSCAAQASARIGELNELSSRYKGLMILLSSSFVSGMIFWLKEVITFTNGRKIMAKAILKRVWKCITPRSCEMLVSIAVTSNFDRIMSNSGSVMITIDMRIMRFAVVMRRVRASIL